MGLRVRLTRSTMAAVCCLMTTFLTSLGPSQGLAAQGSDGGHHPTGNRGAIESAGRGIASRLQSLPARQAHPSPPSPLQPINGAHAAALQASYGRLPLSFELNDGQTNGQVKALARGAGYTLFLTGSGATLALVKREAQPAQRGLSRRLAHTRLRAHGQPLRLDRLGSLLARDMQPAKVTESVVRLNFVGANPHPQVVGLDKLPDVSNYFIGNDRKIGVPTSRTTPRSSTKTSTPASTSSSTVGRDLLSMTGRLRQKPIIMSFG